MRNSIVAIFLTALAGNAMAEWTRITAVDGVASYTDMSTVRRSAKTVKMWTLTDYDKPRSLGGKSSSSAVMLTEFDCTDQRSRVLQRTDYQGRMREGAPIHFATDTPWDWEYVEPGTVGETILKIACARK